MDVDMDNMDVDDYMEAQEFDMFDDPDENDAKDTITFPISTSSPKLISTTTSLQPDEHNDSLSSDVLLKVFSLAQRARFLHEYLCIPAVCKRWKRLWTTMIPVSWRAACRRAYGIDTIPSLGKLNKNDLISNGYWRREYIRRYFGRRKRWCSFCSYNPSKSSTTSTTRTTNTSRTPSSSLVVVSRPPRPPPSPPPSPPRPPPQRRAPAVFTEGDFHAKRGVVFCQPCYSKQVLSAETAKVMLMRNLSRPKFGEMMRNGMMVKQAFTVGKFPYYLKCDLEYFIRLMGNQVRPKPFDFRRSLYKSLVQAGVDVSEAEHYAENAFFPEKTTLEESVMLILKSAKPSLFKKHIEAKRERERVEAARLKAVGKEEAARRQQVSSTLAEMRLDPSATRAYYGVIESFVKNSGEYTFEQLFYLIAKSAGKQRGFSGLLGQLDSMREKGTLKNIPQSKFERGSFG